MRMRTQKRSHQRGIFFSCFAVVFCLFGFSWPGAVFGADCHWQAGTGNWSLAANWSCNHAPGSTDDAFIDANDTYTVTLDVDATVNSLTLGSTTGGTQTLANSSKTLTLTNSSTINSNGVLNFNGGTLTGAGDLTVNGTLNWSNGTMSGTGTTTIPCGRDTGDQRQLLSHAGAHPGEQRDGNAELLPQPDQTGRWSTTPEPGTHGRRGHAWRRFRSGFQQQRDVCQDEWDRDDRSSTFPLTTPEPFDSERDGSAHQHQHLSGRFLECCRGRRS